MGANGMPQRLDRRGFLKSAAGAGTMLAFGPAVLGDLRAADNKDTIDVALIGAGEQGKVLMEAARRIPGVRFQAVCDIWPFNRRWVARRLGAYRHGSNAYEDYREAWVDQAKWDSWVRQGYLGQVAEPERKLAGAAVAMLDLGESDPPPSYLLPAQALSHKPFHQPHLENFFDAIRGKAKLTCSAEVGYETAVTVLKVNEAAEAGRRLEFKPEEFLL